MMKAKNKVYRIEDGNITWFWMNSTVAQYVKVGDLLVLGTGICGKVEKKGLFGWKLRCPDGSVYRVSWLMLKSCFWARWASEQPDI